MTLMSRWLSTVKRWTRQNWPLVLIFVVGLGLRSYHLETAPAFNETADEFAWTWSGMTLVRKPHVPTAWTFLPAYGGPLKWTMYNGAGYHLVKPWLDHPPLFSLVMGVWMTQLGFKDILRVDLWHMRLLMLFFFVANFWLTCALLFKFFKRDVVTVAAAFFAVAPIVVLDQKLVISENFLLFVYTLTHLAILRWDETGHKRWLAAVALGAMSLPLTKVAALAISLYLLVLAARRRKLALLAVVCAATVAGLAGYWLYGRHFDEHLFWEVMQNHRGRFTGFAGFFEFMFIQKIVNTRFIYPPFLLGMGVALFGLGRSSAREYYVQLVAYAGCMTIFVDLNNVYGWYLIPMYPVLCAGLAEFVIQMVRDPEASPWLPSIWALFTLTYAATWLHTWYPAWMVELRYAYLAVLGAAALIPALARRARVTAVVGASLVVLQLAVDFKYLLMR